MPGPSRAPIFAAVGTALLLGGLVFGGVLALAGLTLLVLALLYWGGEALREHDRLEPAPAPGLPAVIAAAPPPGVHIPAPSFRPFLAAVALFALFGGLVAMGEPQPEDDVRPPTLILVSVLILVWALIGWLRDARLEYVEAERADRTGHLQPLGSPTWPKVTLVVWAVLLVGGGLNQFGILPPRSGDGGGVGPEPSPGASAEATLPPGTIELRAKGIAFLTKELRVAAGQPFAIHFVNDDPPAVPHDVDIRGSDAKTVLQDKPTIDGGTDVVYEYAALDAGTYVFICSIHPIPAMTGTLIVE